MKSVGAKSEQIVFYWRKGLSETGGYEVGANLCFIGGKDQMEPVGTKTGQIVFYWRKGQSVTGGCEDGTKYIIGEKDEV